MGGWAWTGEHFPSKYQMFQGHSPPAHRGLMSLGASQALSMQDRKESTCDTPPGIGRTAQQCPQGQRRKKEGEKAPLCSTRVPLGFSKIPDTSWAPSPGTRNLVSACCFRLLLLPQETVPHRLPPKDGSGKASPSPPQAICPTLISEPLTQACSEQSPSPQSMCTHRSLY